VTEEFSIDERVLILAPTGRDAVLARTALTEAGWNACICQDIDFLCREVMSGAGLAVIAKEALDDTALKKLQATLQQQPTWSDLPLVILTSGGTPTAERRRRMEALSVLGNATLLERPLRVATLISAVRVGLQSRHRQYELRDHLRERARLEAALQAEYEKQYHIAETLQRSLLTRDEADVGGDFFDAFALNDERLAFAVGDVSGKGLAAATRTAEVKYVLRAFLREHASPAQALDRLNDFLLDGQTLDGQPLSSFVCLAVGVLETATGLLTIANAGAEAPLILPADGEARPVPGHAPPLGVTATAEYTDYSLPLATGDRLLLMTDGLTEARRGREFFGYEGLVATAQRMGGQHSLKALTEALVSEAAEFAGGLLGDDVCVLAIRILEAERSPDGGETPLTTP
jgi:serine phosphatase RsbU (regulator of sigma subunit)